MKVGLRSVENCAGVLLIVVLSEPSVGGGKDGCDGCPDAVLDDVLEAVLDGVLDGVLDEALEGVLEATLEGVLEATLEGVLDGMLEAALEGVLDEALEDGSAATARTAAPGTATASPTLSRKEARSTRMRDLHDSAADRSGRTS